jgi:polysaccharide chain length determinant protein (PEP-CTERM system associated)
MDHTQLTMEGDNDAGLAIRRVLRICKKGRWLIAFSALVAVVGTTTALTFVPSEYKSEATILIAEQEISPNLVAPLTTVSAAQKLQAMQQEILSQSRLLEIMNEFGLFANQENMTPEGKVNLMRAAIEVLPIDSRLDQFSAFSISFTAGSPHLAQDVTKRLCSVFIERNKEKQETRATSTKNFIQEQVAEKHAKLAGIEQRMQDFKTQHAGDLPEDRPANESRLQDARSQLESAAANLTRAKGQRVIWETALVGDLNARVTRLKAERETLLKNYTPQYREVVAKDEQIAQLEGAAQAVKSGAPLPQAVLATADSNISQLGGQLEANKLEIDSLTNEETRQNAKITEYERRLNAAASLEQQLASMVRESNELGADVTDVMKKEQQTGMAVDVERRQEGGQFQQLDPPSLPNHPASPARLKISFVGAVAGALFGLALTVLLDARKSAYHSEEELRERFAPPLLLSVPALLTRKEQRARSWMLGFEAIAGTMITLAIVAVEFYVYRHP